MPRYVSVLDDKREVRAVTLSEAILAGYAPDGGMYWPCVVPTLSRERLDRLRRCSYRELCAEILKMFLTKGDCVDEDDIDEILLRNDAFERFGNKDVVTMHALDDKLVVAELWHGPTLAFKDLGMSVLTRLLALLVRKKKKRSLTLLVGTSGDTGSSAAEAVRGLEDCVDICVLYPTRQCSNITAVQERQMTIVSENEANVHCVAVEGGSDELDVPIENCFGNRDLASYANLGSVNSVNIIRLLVQTVHYFFAYFHVQPQDTDSRRVRFVVPSGAGGHLAAGILATRMGLPHNCELVSATNANDGLSRFFRNGVLTTQDDGNAKTISPSMDIRVPYNVWRMLYTVAPGRVGQWYAHCAEQKRVVIPMDVVKELKTMARVSGVAVSDEDTLKAIRYVYETYDGYTIDPHTAVGVATAVGNEMKTTVAGSIDVCFACAHPVKFCETVERAIDEKIDKYDASHKIVSGVRNMELVESPRSIIPRGCCGLLRKKDQKQWTAELEIILKDIVSRREGDVISRRSKARVTIVIGCLLVAALGCTRG